MHRTCVDVQGRLYLVFFSSPTCSSTMYLYIYIWVQVYICTLLYDKLRAYYVSTRYVVQRNGPSLLRIPPTTEAPRRRATSCCSCSASARSRRESSSPSISRRRFIAGDRDANEFPVRSAVIVLEPPLRDRPRFLRVPPDAESSLWDTSPGEGVTCQQYVPSRVSGRRRGA